MNVDYTRYTKALAAAALFSAGLISACHADGQMFHDCDRNRNYSSDWNNYDLDLAHQEPRYCPVPLSQTGEFVYLSAAVIDRWKWDFLYDRLQIRNSYNELKESQVAQFRYEPDLEDRWVAQHNVVYPAATGSVARCEDRTRYEMIERAPGSSASSLPWATVDISYTIENHIC